MQGKIVTLRVMLILQILITLVMFLMPPVIRVKAQSVPFNAYDLIGAVNSLRAAYGLPEFNINGSLMTSAQAHSEYQAAIQSMTHYGPGGNTANERAAAAGYLGRVSENIAVYTLGFEDVLSWVVYDAWADDVHMNTMINAQYQDVGAGVAVGGDRVYITLDAGWPEGRYPLPTRMTWTPGSTTSSNLTSVPVFEPILVSTPGSDGSLVHVVGYGQSLIAIAGAYGVQVNDLATQNNINPDQIYAGQRLIIHPGITPTITIQTTTLNTPEPPPLISTPTATQTIPDSSSDNPLRITGIIIIAVCVIATAVLLTSNKK